MEALKPNPQSLLCRRLAPSLAHSTTPPFPNKAYFSCQKTKVGIKCFEGESVSPAPAREEGPELMAEHGIAERASGGNPQEVRSQLPGLSVPMLNGHRPDCL